MIDLLNLLPGNEKLQYSCISWPKVWVAMALEKALTLAGVAATMLRPDITWARVRYWKSGGRIVRVLHPP